MKPTSAKHTTVPQHKEALPERAKMATYELTDVEKAFAKAGEFHLIPTAKDRGIEPVEVEKPLERPKFGFGDKKRRNDRK